MYLSGFIEKHILFCKYFAAISLVFYSKAPNKIIIKFIKLGRQNGTLKYLDHINQLVIK